MVEEVSKAIEAKLTSLGSDRQTILDSAGEMARAYDGAIYGLDLLAFATLKRSLSLSSGFETMIRSRNLICAASLLRLQLDSALRFYATFIVDNPHNFALQIMDGEQVRRLKDRDGNKMTDRYLLEHLATEHPWITSVYEHTSGYIHLSHKHIFNTFSNFDDETGSCDYQITAADPPFPDEIYVDAIEAFHQSTAILLRYIKGWTFTKDNPDLVESINDSTNTAQ
jgi:hypothetical protein